MLRRCNVDTHGYRVYRLLKRRDSREHFQVLAQLWGWGLQYGVPIFNVFILRNPYIRG